jgi:hypothetical protein
MAVIAFPPWIHTWHKSHTTTPAGHFFILSPPESRSFPDFGVEIHSSRLVVEMVLVASVAALSTLAALTILEKLALVSLQNRKGFLAGLIVGAVLGAISTSALRREPPPPRFEDTFSFEEALGTNAGVKGAFDDLIPKQKHESNIFDRFDPPSTTARRR